MPIPRMFARNGYSSDGMDEETKKKLRFVY
jgi:hypothetical protein